MSKDDLDLQEVQPGEQVQYRCSLCGDCCRHVTGRIMLETLDVFRIARYLGKKDPECKDMGRILMRYAEPSTLDDEWGYPIFLIKTVGEDGACIFLKDNRCTIQPVKPRTCRLYPFTAAPGTCGKEFTYYLCLDSHKQHLLTNSRVDVTEWLQDAFSAEDKQYIREEYAFISILGKRLRALPPSPSLKAFARVVFYKYFNFDVDKPFLPQYAENNRALMLAIEKLADAKL